MADKGKLPIKRKQSTLPFLAKRSQAESEDDIQDIMAAGQSGTQTAEPLPSPTVSSSLVFPVSGPYDFGTLRESFLTGKMSNEQKYKALTNLDRPKDFQFPPNIEGGQKRSFQSSWFQRYPWLTYSRSESGGYCAFCVAFSSESGNTGVLVKSPLVKFKKALDILSTHNNTEYHKDACAKFTAFSEVMSGKQKDIAQQLCDALSATVQQNRKIVKSIMATVELCG